MSKKQVSFSTINDILKYIEFLDKKYLNLKKRCDKVYMIGFSLGGCISAYVASLKSIRPEGLIIVNGVFGVKNVFNKLLPGVMIYNKVPSFEGVCII